MGDHQYAKFAFIGEIFHSSRTIAKSIDIQTRVELIQHHDARVQHGKLQRFVALLLATREIHVHCAMNECLVQTDTGSLSTDAFGQLCLVTPPLGEGFVEQFVDAHSRDLGWILHHQVKTRECSLPRGK